MDLTQLSINLLRGALGLSLGSAIVVVIGIALVVVAFLTRRMVFVLLPLGFGLLIGGFGIFNPNNVFGFAYAWGISTNILPLVILFLLGLGTDFRMLMAKPRALFAALPVVIGVLGSLIVAGALRFPLKDAAAVALVGSLNPASLVYAANTLSPDLVGLLGLAAILILILQRWSVTLLVDSAKSMPNPLENEPVPSGQADRSNLLIFALVITALVGIFFRPALAFVAAFVLGVLFRPGEENAEMNSWVWKLLQGFFALAALAIGSSLSAGVLFTPVALRAGIAILAGAALTVGGSFLIFRSAWFRKITGDGDHSLESLFMSILPGVELIGALITGILMTIVIAVT